MCVSAVPSPETVKTLVTDEWRLFRTFASLAPFARLIGLAFPIGAVGPAEKGESDKERGRRSATLEKDMQKENERERKRNTNFETARKVI